MGNVESDGDAGGANSFVEAARFKSELAEMQRSMVALYGGPSPALLPHQRLIDGAVVSCAVGVRVLLGPVIGKVEFESARILLEVNTRTAVTCHVSIRNSIANAMTELPQCRTTMTCEPNRPTAFRVSRLLPGRDYRFAFSGVAPEDVELCRGSFTTPTLETGASELRAVVMSGDDPFGLDAGEFDLWRDVRKRVEDKSAHVVLHLGGQVALKRMFDYSCLLLLHHANSTENAAETSGGHWKRLEERAVDILRDAYRAQWTRSSDIRFVLANASNLMMWSDADVYPGFTTRREFFIDHGQPTLQMQVIRTVTRCARRLFHEYQRQLWDDDMEQLHSREAELLAMAESALASAGRIFRLSQQITKVAQELELQKQRREIEGARRVDRQLRSLEAEKVKFEKQLVSYNQALTPQRGEEFVYCVGSIAVFMMDLRSSRIEPGGAQAADNAILSTSQWDYFERTLERETTRLVVLCMELPLVSIGLRSPKSAVTTSENNQSNIEDAVNVMTWSNSGDAQTHLLSTLFEWKLEHPNRQFVILTGGSDAGSLSATTSIKDTKLRTEAAQYVTGAITCSPTKSLHLETNTRVGSLHNRFEFEHVLVEPSKKGFLTLSVTNDTGGTHRIDVGHIDDSVHSSSFAQVVVGPVVGWVDDKSAVVLLEVDRDADFACVFVNPFTQERQRVFQRFRANRPNSFYLTRLRSEHFYQISFSSIQHPDEFRASFTTLAPFPERFGVVAVCNDAPLISADPLALSEGESSKSLWHELAELTADSPFSEVDFMVHLGGQYFPRQSPFVHEALLLAEELSRNDRGTGTDQELSSVSDRIANKLRQFYRLEWTAPGVRETLASGAHLFLTNENDCIADDQVDSASSLLIRKLLRQVHRDYHDSLLPPIMRASQDTTESAPKAISHYFGSFGMFVLQREAENRSEDGRFISSAVWDQLEAFLAEQTMHTLLLITTEPVIDESPEEAMEKAKVSSEYRRRLGFHSRDLARLLKALFDWQRPNARSAASEVSTSKHVILLSGSRLQSFDSIIQDISSSAASNEVSNLPALSAASGDDCSIRQMVVGPLGMSCAANSDDQSTVKSTLKRAVFPEGSFFGRYTYKHIFARPKVNYDFDDHDSQSTTISGSDSTSKDSKAMRQLVFISCSTPVASSEVDSISEKTMERCVCHFLFRDPVEPRDPTNRQKTADSVPSGSCIRIEHETIRHDKSGNPLQGTKLPMWLAKITVDPLTSDEEKEIADRAEILDSKVNAISASFELSAPLVDGVLGLSDKRRCAVELSRLFSEFHRLGGSAVQESFPKPPSALIVQLILQRSVGDGTDVPNEGAIDAALFARILSKCFLDGWLFTSRLERMWGKPAT